MTRGKYAARANNRERSELLEKVECLTEEARSAKAEARRLRSEASLVPGLKADNSRLRQQISDQVAPEVERLNAEVARLRADHKATLDRLTDVVTHLLDEIYEHDGAPVLADQKTIEECLGIVAPNSGSRWVRRIKWTEGRVNDVVAHSAGEQLSDGRTVRYAGKKVIAT